MGRGNGDEGPVKGIKGQEVNFHCSMLPCIHFELEWIDDPLQPPRFTNWRAFDDNGQPVNLSAAQQQQVIRDVTTGAFPIEPPKRVSTMPCIAPCSCTDEQAFPWINKGQFIPIDFTFDVRLPGSTATTVKVSVTWLSGAYRWVIGRCTHTE
jgi:hypothetical protein